MPVKSRFSAAGANRKPKKIREIHEKPFSKEEMKALRCGMVDVGIVRKRKRKPDSLKCPIRWKAEAWHARFFAELRRHGSIKLACQFSGANYATAKSSLSKQKHLREKADEMLADHERRKMLRMIHEKAAPSALSKRRLKHLKLAGMTFSEKSL